jgi:hypothetical protein
MKLDEMAMTTGSIAFFSNYNTNSKKSKEFSLEKQRDHIKKSKGKATNVGGEVRTNRK